MSGDGADVGGGPITGTDWVAGPSCRVLHVPDIFQRED